MKMHITDLLHETAVADNALLYGNDAKGDIFSIARDVDFMFKTPHRERANILAMFVNEKNYGIAEVKHVPEDDLYWLSVVIHTPVNQHVICSRSGLMVFLARLFNLEYDGWGSVIQTAQ